MQKYSVQIDRVENGWIIQKSYQNSGYRPKAWVINRLDDLLTVMIKIDEMEEDKEA